MSRHRSVSNEAASLAASARHTCARAVAYRGGMGGGERGIAPSPMRPPHINMFYFIYFISRVSGVLSACLPLLAQEDP
eukprot:419749-Prorocentrum_minimum.AAC.1